jgi:hypothetical protein
VQARVATRTSLVASAARGPTVTGVGARVGAHDVERLGRAADLEAPALPTGELMRTVVASQDASGDVDDVARALAQPAVAGQERRAPGAGQEAQVLRIGRRRHGSSCSAAIARTCAFSRSPSGKRRRASVARDSPRACRPGPWPDRRPGAAALGRAARVVPGGQRGGADAIGEGEHGVQAHVPVAAHAWVGRQPAAWIGQPRLDDAGAELVAQVQGEVREAHAVGDGRAPGHRRWPSSTSARRRWRGRATARG